MRVGGLASKRAVFSILLIVMAAGAVSVLFRAGLTKNWADIEEGAADPALRPIDWPEAPAEAVGAVTAIVDRLPRWKVEEADPKTGTVHATRRTRVWRFVDDIHLRFEPTGEGCRITGHSQSRVGKGDLGQNARNLKELAEVLRIPGAERIGSR